MMSSGAFARDAEGMNRLERASSMGDRVFGMDGGSRFGGWWW